MTEQKRTTGCVAAIAITVLIMLIVFVIIIASVTSSATEEDSGLYISDVISLNDYIKFNIHNDSYTTYNNIEVIITFTHNSSTFTSSTSVFIDQIESRSQRNVSAKCDWGSSLLVVDFDSDEGYFNIYTVYDNSKETNSSEWVIILVGIFFMFIVIVAVVVAINQSAKNNQKNYFNGRNNQQSPFSGFGGQPTQNYTYKNQQTGNTQPPNQTQAQNQPQAGNTNQSPWYDGYYKKPAQNNEQQNKEKSYQQQTPNNTQKTADSAQGSKSDYYKQLAGQLNQKAQQTAPKQPNDQSAEPILKEAESIAPASENWTTDFYIPEPPKPVQPDMTPVKIESDLLKQAHDGHICKNCGYKANAKKHYCPNCLAPLDDDFTMH